MQKELTLQEFYAVDPRRAHSREVGHGSLWREFAPVPNYRLGWVQDTGELYEEAQFTQASPEPVQ